MRSKCLEPKEGSFEFFYDGQPFKAMPGDTIGAALISAGERVGRYTQKGNPRHLFCGIGVCFECMVVVQDLGIVRACMTKVQPGMEVLSWPKSGLPDSKNLPALGEPPVGNIPWRSCQLGVIGSGPGGLAAATAAAQCGVEVVIFDERPSSGGQLYKQLIPSMKSVSGGPLDSQYADGMKLIDEAKEAGCTFLNGALVWRAAYDGSDSLELSIYSGGSITYYKPQHLVIATGAYDEPLPVPGWTLPGVMTAGAAQTLVRSYGVIPPGPVVVAGSGPLVLQVAYELARAGADVAAVISSTELTFDKLPAVAVMLLNNPKITLLGLKYLKEIRNHKIPLINGHVITEIGGSERCESVKIAPLGKNGDPDLSRIREFQANTVCQSYGLLPANEVARQLGCHFEPDNKGFRDLVGSREDNGQSSLKLVHLVGEAGGIVGGYMALYQGYLAGWRIAEKLGYEISQNRYAQVGKEFKKHQRFQKHLWHTLEGPVLNLNNADEDTVICRCEEVTCGALRNAMAQGAQDMGSLKRLTRAGMGRCQGRYCGTFVARMLSEQLQRPLSEKEYNVPQAPLKPIPLSVLAVEKKEWGGHKRSSLGEPGRFKPNDLKAVDVEVLVIGAGIAGCSTAFWLGREGIKSIIVDKGAANSQASGGNAGSLHVQLLSFDFGNKAESGGSPALKTLQLQKEAVALWKELQDELSKDFQIKTVGGLMVAENEQDVRFLEEKAAAERGVGIDVRVIDSKELHQLEPAISELMIAASYCPEEGKINPLTATQGILDAALDLGQEIHTGIEVFAVEKVKSGFVVHTSAAKYRCKNVVNAAGAWASKISGMVGREVPVHGAPLQMIITEPVEPVISHLIAHGDRHLSMKQANNGNIIIGGGWTGGWNKVVNFPTTLRDSLEGNTWVARRTVPCLDGVNIIRSWSAMNINIDGSPILGEMPGVPGFYNTVSSNGYTLGPILGKVTSELIARGKSVHDISFCSLDRFN
ncbi:FAD-dependent oxidoreductase [Crocinitomicaceae bacterium]|nr:FAD-dependent oxidoreductase [Crocinitomicaceae bacterium]